MLVTLHIEMNCQESKAVFLRYEKLYAILFFMGAHISHNKIYAQSARYGCYLLDASDWKIFKEIRLAQWADSQDPEMFAKEISQKPEYWRNWLEEEHEKIFCLFENQTPVGVTSLKILDPDEDETLPSALFTGSYRLSRIKGTGAGDVLHEARINYLLKKTNCDYAQINISQNNVASWKAAKRYGFRTDSDIDPLSEDAVIFVLNVAALRSPKPRFYEPCGP